MLLLCDYYVFIKFLYRLYPKIIMSVSKPHNTHSITTLYSHCSLTVLIRIHLKKESVPKPIDTPSS